MLSRHALCTGVIGLADGGYPAFFVLQVLVQSVIPLTHDRSRDGRLFGLVCLDCCGYPIKQATEAGEIDVRSVFPNMLRQDMLAKIS